MIGRLNGNTAVITGGGRGIGRSIALAMAKEGADIVVASDVESELHAVVAEITGLGRRALAHVLDVTSPEAVTRFADLVKDHFRNARILVNNAGIVGKRSFITQSDDAIWRRTIEVNLFGTYHCTKAFLPEIIEQGKGRIINMASISGKQASPTNSAYAASKHGVIGITRTVAAELGILGLTDITCNAVCPGVVNTTMLTGPGMILDELSQLLGTSREQVLEERIKTLNIQHRVMDPEEIAAMTVFLASDDARGITGQALNVCGGSVFY
ncbi:MAG: SDR family oxidoreductase [Desulfobacteraceae bacterium]|nr:MAG: SDR family oxidoreductase [Desulfobacteraceae bacterium]